MPQTKADRLLQRITALHESLRADPEGQPSRLERDLMLGYLRDLYEIYAPGDGAVVERPAAPSRPPQPAATAPPPSPAAAPPAVPPVPTAPVPPPQAPPMTGQTAVVQPAVPPAPAPPPRHVPPPSAPAPDLPAELEELFAAGPESGDLAARLGRQPIRDLTRAMTINNRVLFSNTLFDNNGDLMNNVLRQLNSLPNQEAARPVLIDLARQHDWAAENKRTTAREFIELVRRRYA